MMIFKFSDSILEALPFLASCQAIAGILVTGAAQLDLDSFQITSIN